MDGAVYEWEVATSKRLHEAVLKACGYTGLGLSADTKTVFAVGTDRKIKEIVDAQVSILSKNHLGHTVKLLKKDCLRGEGV